MPRRSAYCYARLSRIRATDDSGMPRRTDSSRRTGTDWPREPAVDRLTTAELFIFDARRRDRLELDTNASGQPVSWVAQDQEDTTRRTQHHACARCRTVAESCWSAGELVAWAVARPARPRGRRPALLFYSAADAAATLIIAYHGVDEAIIAADSLAINIAAVPPRPGLACKIQNFSDVVFADATSSIPEGILAFDALSARSDDRPRPTRVISHRHVRILSVGIVRARDDSCNNACAGKARSRRQANAALYRAVIVRMRYHQPTVDYVARRTADGRTKREIIRCLKRFLAREIYQRVMTDFRARQEIIQAA